MFLSIFCIGFVVLVFVYGIRVVLIFFEFDFNIIFFFVVNLIVVMDLVSYSDFIVYDNCDCNKNNGNEYCNKFNCDVSFFVLLRFVC